MPSICALENSQSFGGGGLPHLLVLIPKKLNLYGFEGRSPPQENFRVFREPVDNFSIKKYMKQMRYF